MTIATIWEFKTRNFEIRMTAEEECDPLDLSWDDDGEVARELRNGKLIAFTAKCTVSVNGTKIATDYLGACIYESPEAFRDHGSSFVDMVRKAIRDARTTLNTMPKLRCA